MKKELYQNIEIPEGIEVSLDEDVLTIKGPEGENKKKINIHNLIFEIKDGKIVIGNKKSTKKEKKQMNTIKAHILNMIKGVKEKFEYKLKVCFSHFPIKIDINEREVTIKNFLGEKIPRKLILPEDVEVKVDKDIITITSKNKEAAGQASAKFESATKVKGRDRRVFQDGIFITNKSGKIM